MAAKKRKTSTKTPVKSNSAALSYVLGPVTGVLFLLIERDEFVRFHAMQSVVVFTVLFLLQWFLGITLIFLPLVPLIGLVSFVLWLLLIYKAWQGDRWEVPVLGKFAVQLSKKI